MGQKQRQPLQPKLYFRKERHRWHHVSPRPRSQEPAFLLQPVSHQIKFCLRCEFRKPPLFPCTEICKSTAAVSCRRFSFTLRVTPAWQRGSGRSDNAAPPALKVRRRRASVCAAASSAREIRHAKPGLAFTSLRPGNTKQTIGGLGCSQPTHKTQRRERLRPLEKPLPVSFHISLKFFFLITPSAPLCQTTKPHAGANVLTHTLLLSVPICL